MSQSNELMSAGAQLIGMPLAGPESFSAEQLAYLKRALGVDETVLYEDLTADGTVVASVVLRETSTNFEEIEITVGWKGGSTSVSAPGKIIFKCKPDGVYYGFGGLVGCDNSSHFVLGGIGTSGTTLALKNVIDLYSANLSSITPQSFNNILRVYKVIGIHRIAGGN